MDYLTPGLTVLAGAGFVCLGAWLLALEGRLFRCRQRVAALERERADSRRLLNYHAFAVGCWRKQLQGRPLSEAEKAILACSDSPQELAQSV